MNRSDEKYSVNTGRQAILVAGMHRSGTSALTRVLSLLGADLPENLAPALPDNNETGFWESVDFMILHDELLASAGSSWDDWTVFNPEWYQTAIADSYRQKIQGVLSRDFAHSPLFVVKDPRICRFLPLWLGILTQAAIDPYVLIPVRNPLEVAQSLQRRDGLPLAAGGFIWLRHVLDAVHFSSQSVSRAFISYEQLMQDWQGMAASITRQTGLGFPRRSVDMELDVEFYLDSRQRHNHAGAAAVNACREFSELIPLVYAHLLALVENPEQPDRLLELESLRNRFNTESSAYAKVLQGQKRAQGLAWEDMCKAHELQLAQRMDACESRASQQSTQHEERLDQQAALHEASLNQQAALHKQHLEEQRKQAALNSKNQTERYERLLLEQREKLQNLNRQLQIAARNASDLRAHAIALSEGKPGVVGSGSVAHGHSFRPPVAAVEHPSRTAVRKAQSALALLDASPLLDKHYYRAQCPELGGDESVAHHYCFQGAAMGLDPHPLFKTRWYLAHNSDVAVSGQNPLVHFLQGGASEGRSPHPLFDLPWYLARYPDIASSGQNPLLHYLAQGGAELRYPHPLFMADWYVAQYPDACVGGITPLVHYLKYGATWGCDPHPLFDTLTYLQGLRDELPAGVTALEYFLVNRSAWYVAPHAGFASAWYLETYPDVLDARLNPLLHFILHGAADRHRPHPDSESRQFRQQYSERFLAAGVSLRHEETVATGSSTLPPTPQDLKDPQDTLIVERCFSNMLRYPRRELAPPRQAFTANRLVIHWVTCDFARSGGGGNMTIFRFIRLFELLGHQQHIWLHNRLVHSTAEAAYEDLVRNYQQTSALIHFIGEEDFEQATGDLVIATDWESVWPVLSARAFKRRFYFVQDHEPEFFPAGGHSLAALATYQEDLDCICAGPWLENLMQTRYGLWATRFWLAADSHVYYPPVSAVRANKVVRIAFYARMSTSRRAVELGLLALDYLARQGLVFQVDVYGGENNRQILEQAAFSYTDHGVLNAEALGALYRECDIGLVFSATNYSLVPQEMMACGLAVLELDGDNTRGVFPDGVLAFTKPHPRLIAGQLQRLIEDQAYRHSLGQAGQQWAQQFDWAEGARSVSEAIQERLVELGFEREEEASVRPVASVVIPVFNGGELLLNVLDAVQAQETPWPFEVLVIDSGSTDGMLAAIDARAGARTDLRVHVIPQSEFSHGGTRNLGVELTRGDYVAFLTQDALPADRFWLFNLVSMLVHEPTAAGVFGRHLPYPEASPFVKRDLTAHFDNLAKFPLYLSRDTDRECFENGEPGWRQVLHFYSDNNSCLRRSVWEKIPYPVIEYGEDQVWADLMIKSGYKKAYAPHAVVYHSHDYDEEQTQERSRIEAQFFERHFGYVLSGAGSEAERERRLQADNERDQAYAATAGVGADDLERQLRLNAARLRGYWAGSLRISR